MSIDIMANVTRAGVPVGSSAVWFQLDEMSQAEARAYGGASAGEGPFDRFNGFMPNVITLLRGDLLTDTVNNDPVTGTKVRYRVIGRPEIFPDGHCEFVADLYLGT